MPLPLDEAHRTVLLSHKVTMCYRVVEYNSAPTGYIRHGRAHKRVGGQRVFAEAHTGGCCSSLSRGRRRGARYVASFISWRVTGSKPSRQANPPPSVAVLFRSVNEHPPSQQDDRPPLRARTASASMSITGIHQVEIGAAGNDLPRREWVRRPEARSADFHGFLHGSHR